MQPGVPSYPALLAKSIFIEEAHINSEYALDVHLDDVMKTVSAHPVYVAAKPGHVEVFTGRNAVRDLYEQRMATEFVPLAWRPITQIIGPWYVFREGVASRHSRTTGQEYTVNSCALIPTAADGIIGEFMWQRQTSQHQWGGRRADASENSEIPVQALRNVRLQEEALNAFCRGDQHAIGQLISDDFVFAMRDYLQGPYEKVGTVKAGNRDVSERYLTDWYSKAHNVRINVIQRHATAWYAFSECIINLSLDQVGKDVSGEASIALLHLINGAGKICGVLSFGTAVHPGSHDTPSPVGASLFKRPDYGNNPHQD